VPAFLAASNAQHTSAPTERAAAAARTEGARPGPES